jgi:hypothetical protein
MRELSQHWQKQYIPVELQPPDEDACFPDDVVIKTKVVQMNMQKKEWSTQQKE